MNQFKTRIEKLEELTRQKNELLSREYWESLAHCLIEMDLVTSPYGLPEGTDLDHATEEDAAAARQYALERFNQQHGSIDAFIEKNLQTMKERLI